jgi:hypothetical protein
VRAPVEAGEERVPPVALAVEPGGEAVPGEPRLVESAVGNEGEVVHLFRVRCERLELQRVARREAQLSVDARERPRAPLVEAPVGRNETELGGLPEVAFVPEHVRIAPSVLDERALLLERENDDRVLVAGREEREAVRPPSPRGLPREERIVDRSRVDRVVVRRAEQVAPFLEERTLLGIEEREGRVNVDLGGVRLDLTEIGVDGRLGAQLRRYVVRGAERNVALHVLVLEAPAAAEGSGLVRDDRGEKLEPLAGLDPPDARHGAPLTGPAVLVAIVGRPRVLVVRLARAVAPEIHLPRLLGLVGEPQARERDRHLRHPAALDDAARRLVDHVIRRVLPRRRREEEVPRDPVRVHGDLVGVRRLAVGVEAQKHDVVREDLVALAEGRPHVPRVVVAHETDVHVAVVVREPGLRIDSRLRVVAGLILGEVRGLRRPAPAGIVQVAVDRDRSGRPRDGDRRVKHRDIPVVGAGRPAAREHRGEDRERGQFQGTAIAA